MRKPVFTLLLPVVFMILSAVTTYSQPPSSSFASLTRKPDAGYYLALNDTVRFWFEEEYHVGENAALSYKISDPLNKQVSNPVSLVVKRGYNEYELDIASLTPAFYLLEVSNAKQEKWYLRFKVE